MNAQQQKKKPIINPFESLDKITHHTPHIDRAQDVSSIFKEIPQVGNNATKVDFDKLNSTYSGQDKKSIEDIQKNLSPEQLKEQTDLQFFRKYKREEEDYYLKRKQEEEEKKQREELEEQEKKRQEEEERLTQNVEGANPQGKKKKSIFGKIREKATGLLPPEMKPGGGKQ